MQQPSVAALSDTAALTEAHNYLSEPYLWRIDSRTRKIKVMTRVIRENTLARLQTYQADENNPAALRDLARQLREALDPTLLTKDMYYINLGDAEVKTAFDTAVANDLLTTTEIEAFEEAATYPAPVPFAGKTLHDVMLWRGSLPAPVSVTRAGTWVTINVTQACERHQPRLLGKTPSGHWQRINNFRDVSAPGQYDCRVPAMWYSAQLAVDNAYGVIEAVA